MSRKNIVLMTDFGHIDNYVGIMKGVILSISPDVNIIDLTHEIHPQNYKQAAFMLLNAVEFFPKDSIFLNVIDPGVGTARNAVALKADDKYFISPDNGLLSYILEKYTPEGVFSLTNSKYFLKYVSATFHGRDIFAPIAAHIANGIELKNFGERISPLSLIRVPEPQCFLDTQGIWHGEVLHIDGFGNIITSLKGGILGIDIQTFPKNHLKWKIESADIKILYLSQTFADVDVGNYLAYIGSSGHLEIGVRDGNAAKKSGIKVGQNVYAYKF